MKINEKNLSTFACTPPSDLDGWLSKRGEVNRAWQRRWFVLKGNLLFYFEKRNDKEPLGVIILEGCTIELAEEDGDQYCFKVIFHGDKDRSYLLAAETQELMERWMKALTCAGYEYMKLMVAELQRQLEELEETQGKAVATTNGKENGTGGCRLEGSSSGRGEERHQHQQQQQPKAPPRRHNPFNKPHGAGEEDVMIRKRDFLTHGRQEPTTTTVTLLGKASTTTTTNPPVASNVVEEEESNEERFSFGTLHAALGQSFLQDRLKRRQEQEEKRSKDDKSPGQEAEEQKKEDKGGDLSATSIVIEGGCLLSS